MKYTKEEFIKELNKITTDPFEILEFKGISKGGHTHCCMAVSHSAFYQ